MNMNSDEVNVLIEVLLEAVQEQYILPLTLALGTLTVAACRESAAAQEVAEALRQQAASCPPDVAGRTLLEALAGLAAGPSPVDPAAVRTALRSQLRLVPGQKDD